MGPTQTMSAKEAKNFKESSIIYKHKHKREIVLARAQENNFFLFINFCFILEV